MHEREVQLTQMLLEARGSLAAMQKLHHASQNQLFAMQSQSEEVQVCIDVLVPAVSFAPGTHLHNHACVLV